MSETRQITLIFAATLILGIAAFVLAIVVPPLLHGDLVVDSYEAKLSDTGTLQEQYKTLIAAIEALEKTAE